MTASWSYNGFEFGGDNYLRVVTAAEGFDMPQVRASDVPIAGGDGSLGGIDTLDSRTVTLTVEIAAESQAELYETLAELRRATVHRSDDIPLTFQLDEALEPMRLYCRPRRRNIPHAEGRHAYGNVTCDLQFFAPDPLIYSDAEYTGSTNAPSPAEGFTFPRDYPYDFGTPGSAEVINAFNAGDAPAPWTAVIYGPCDQPSIVGPGGNVTWEGSLGEGESLVIDAHPARRWVRVGGTSSQFALLSDDSVWWLLEPGSNNVVLNSGDGNGTVEFRWRSAFYGAT
jgi:hypothetical protein